MSQKKPKRKKTQRSRNDPNSMADRHFKRMSSIGAKKGSSTIHIYFTDGSQLVFEANANNPNPRAIGGKESFADRFASDVREFGLDPELFRISFVFKDNSRWDLDMSTVPHQRDFE